MTSLPARHCPHTHPFQTSPKMQYSTPSFAAAVAVVASFSAPAAAMFDEKACNGIGACTSPSGCNYWPNGEPQQPEWDCGSAGTINGQVAAGAELNFEKGLSAGTVVSAADFPSSCNLARPGSNATLLVGLLFFEAKEMVDGHC